MASRYWRETGGIVIVSSPSLGVKYLSLVVPSFNEEISIPVFYKEAVKICVTGILGQYTAKIYTEVK